MLRTIAILLLLSALNAGAGTLRFAPLPLLDEHQLRLQFLPLLDYLARETGEKFEFVYLKNNDEIVEALASGKIELAHLGPLPYVQLRRRMSHAEPLVHFLESDGSSAYRCVLAAYGDGAKPKTRELTHKRFALTQPASTCGPFAVNAMLRRAGRALDKDGNSHAYLGSHDKTALAVVQGKADVVGVKQNIAEKYRNLGLQVFDEVGPFPGLALVADTHALSPQRREAIRRAMLGAEPARRAGWGDLIRHGTAPARDVDYDAIREILRESGEDFPGARR